MLWKSISICFEHVSQRFDKTINNKFEMQFKIKGAAFLLVARGSHCLE